jgi:hypothetical protein
MRAFLAIVVVSIVAALGPAGIFLAMAAETDGPTKAAFDRLREKLAAAQREENEPEILRIAAEGRTLLGQQAGVPEVADEFRPAPSDVAKLTPDEARNAFEPYVKLIHQRRWWRIGQDPAQTKHLPREAASVITGCVAACRAHLAGSDAALALAQDAADYLIWAQQQAARGLIPFPAVRGGQGRPLEVSERFLRRAEHDGRLEQILHNGWIVDDLGDGGLQFDNGLAGVALFELYQLTGDNRYRQSAVAATDWAIGRPVVPNWNYNSFSVYLLAKAYRVTQEKKYLDAAQKKARLGIYPGQLLDGPNQGRWADPHNARPAYHYIMVRGLAVLLGAMSVDDPDRVPAVRCLRLALAARNAEFATQGISTVDSAMEAMVEIQSLPASTLEEFRVCHIASAFDVLERYVAAGYRAHRPPLSPGAWGRYLEYRTQW